MLSAEVVQSVKPLADTKRLALEILPIDKPAPVWARHSDLKKLIVILLDNAIKYTPEGGRIEVRISHFSDQSFLEVRDTGIGITEEEIPHIFERSIGQIRDGLAKPVVLALVSPLRGLLRTITRPILL